MPSRSDLAISIYLADEAATDALGARLAACLGPRDTVLLEGGIGAGKTHLARALIQSRLAAIGRTEDVPSPTFTLIQTYDAGNVEIWHADLYRLGDPGEIDELGLQDAFGTALCLVEWPDRLGASAPADALHIALGPEGDGRRATITGTSRYAPLLSSLAKEFTNG